MLWYQPPADAQSLEWPQNVEYDAVGLSVGIPPGSYPARFGAAEDDEPTLYYPDVLSAVADTVDDDVIRELSEALSALNMSIARGPAFRGGHEVTLMLGTIAEGEGEPEAWAALERLREMAAPGDGNPAPLSAKTSAAVKELALRRLYITGMPAKDGHSAGDRAAVTLLAVPARTDPSRIPGGRRPVVAIIDSGVGEHPWLTAGDDPFWFDARDHGWTGAPQGLATNETPGDVTPADGTLDTHFGHGTFITGLIRQLAPDARVLSIPAMSGSGVLDETVVLDALSWLLDRVRTAHTDPSTFVDVVNLSFGYYERAAADTRYTRELRRLLGDLGHLGVQVVASAGNDATTRPVFPAAFADPHYGAKPEIGLISVGALNPDGSRAEYSNVDSTWPQHWEPGTAVTSTMPKSDVVPNLVPAAYDPKDLVGGFARWSGTSFAAGVASARLARALSATAAGHDLLDVSPAAVRARMLRARKSVVGID